MDDYPWLWRKDRQGLTLSRAVPVSLLIKYSFKLSYLKMNFTTPVCGVIITHPLSRGFETVKKGLGGTTEMLYIYIYIYILQS